MKAWTIQKKSILDQINENGIYYPDINKSSFVNERPNLKDLYNTVLTSFNTHNNCNYSGLIFSFFNYGLNAINPYPSYDTFKRAIMYKGPGKIEDFWNRFSESDSVILELDYDEDFNPIFIDINDFQIVMPPIFFAPPITEEAVDLIFKNINAGTWTYSVMPSRLMQAHFPYIKKENITGIYDFFSISNSPYIDNRFKIMEILNVLNELEMPQIQTIYDAIKEECVDAICCAMLNQPSVSLNNFAQILAFRNFDMLPFQPMNG